MHEKGQRVLDFIKFVRKYDRYVNSQPDSHIVDKMYNALERFDELNAIPPSLISVLPPFALSKRDADKASYHPFGFHFKTMNESIIEFFDKLKRKEGKLVYENSEFQFKKDIEKRKIKSHVSNFDTKALKVISKLNRSAILCMQRANDQLKSNHYRIGLPSSSECMCPKCRISKLDMADALKLSLIHI